MSSETIADIVREMREDADNEHSAWMTISKDEYRKLCDRIKAAAKHTCEYAIPNFGCASENRYLEENARLRAALKPVLACDTDFDICGAYEDGSSLDLVEAPYDAVLEAKRIYNESEVK